MSWCGLIAGALAVLYGVIGGLFAVAGGIELAGGDALDPVGTAVFLALVVVSAVLLVGGVLLLVRKASGRWTVAGGAALSMGGIAYVLLRTSTAPMGVTPELAASGNTEVRHIAVIALVLAVMMFALALVPQREQGPQPPRA